MKKLVVIILVVLLAAMAVAVPAFADNSDSAHACDGIRNALFNAGKDSPAGAVLEYQMKLHCSGGAAIQ